MQARFVAHEQGLKAVKLGIPLLNDQPAAIEFGVEWRVVFGLLVGGPSVAGDVGLDASGGTGLP